ncbi:MAG TPA: hypothetical protein VGC40_14010 [Paenirhodobacter sp.]
MSLISSITTPILSAITGPSKPTPVQNTPADGAQNNTSQTGTTKAPANTNAPLGESTCQKETILETILSQAAAATEDTSASLPAPTLTTPTLSTPTLTKTVPPLAALSEAITTQVSPAAVTNATAGSETSTVSPPVSVTEASAEDEEAAARALAQSRTETVHLESLITQITDSTSIAAERSTGLLSDSKEQSDAATTGTNETQSAYSSTTLASVSPAPTATTHGLQLFV